MSDLDARLDEARAWVEAGLERHLPREDEDAAGTPARLATALRYSALGGGKRVRPAVVRLAAEVVAGGPLADGAEEACWRAAVAVELVHAYSLVHDDLPCMDDDDLRRGRPTCHVVHGEALAVLVGDALQTLAFEVLAGAGPRAAEMVAVLARAAGAAGMVGGQVLDVDSEGGGAVPRAVVEAIHAKKTAALFSASAELGALAAGAGDEARATARELGLALGLAFQATDDVLDVVGDAATLGKTPGKDANLERATLVAALGLEGAREEADRLVERASTAARRLGEAEGGALQALARRVGSRDR